MITLTLTTEEAAALRNALGYAITMHTVGPGCATNPVDDENQQQAQHLQGTIGQTLDPTDFCACAACEATDNPSFPCDDCGNATPASEHCGGPTTDAERLQCQAKGEEPYLCADCYGIRIADDDLCPDCGYGLLETHSTLGGRGDDETTCSEPGCNYRREG